MQTTPIAVILTDTHLFEKRTKQDSIIDCNYDLVLKAFTKAIQLAKSNNLEYVFHAGDFFDSRKHQTKTLLQMTEKILSLFSQSEIKLVIINGNHDMTAYDESYSFLSPFKHHPNVKHIETFDFIDIDKYRFHFLSFFENDLYVDYLNQVKENISDNHKNILITHIGIHGALKNDGEKDASSITFKMFEDFDKVLIGHFHNYSSHIKDKIVYIGGAFPQNFGEDNKKGVVVLDSILHLTRQKTEFKEYKTIEIDVANVSKEDIEDLLNQQLDEYQRVIIVGKEELIKAFDRTQLTEVGIKVVVKPTQREVKEIIQQIGSHDNESIFKNFSNFCHDNSFEEQEGLIYLNQII